MSLPNRLRRYLESINPWDRPRAYSVVEWFRHRAWRLREQRMRWDQGARPGRCGSGKAKGCGRLRLTIDAHDRLCARCEIPF